MAKKRLPRLEGESEDEFWKRYRREKSHAYYHKHLQRDRKPREPKEPKAGRAGKKYNIIRREGESQADFDRRYACERQRIKRAIAKGADPEVNCEILEKGPYKNSPFSLEEWEAVRQRPDESDREWNNRTAAARHKVYAAKHPERLKQRGRDWYYAHPDKELERRLRYRRENPEKVKATQDRYCETHKAERAFRYKRWAEKNPEKRRAMARAWHAANPGIAAFYSARYNADKREATPPWADFDIMKRFHAEARRISQATGIPHSVDHIVPIQGDAVRGLNVHTNLRIIPVSANSAKGNKLIPELLEFFDALIIW